MIDIKKYTSIIAINSNVSGHKYIILFNSEDEKAAINKLEEIAKETAIEDPAFVEYLRPLIRTMKMYSEKNI